MLGKQIAHYSVESELGRGGMGVVYRARDLRLERTVALKLLAEEYAQRTEQRQLILSEARAAAALNHPGVTTIYEVGEHEGRLFIAMELVAINRCVNCFGKARLSHGALSVSPRKSPKRSRRCTCTASATET
jgi:serine/threonine protein kinase